jgi:hypothetical protein
MKKLIFFLLLAKCVFSDYTPFTVSESPYSLFLINDSPFELTAIIQSATGTFLGQEILQPGEQRQWTADLERLELKGIYDADASITPFTVIWKCSYKGYYSICTQVSPGATVSAHGCSGSKECTPKPKKDERQPCCPPCPTEDNEDKKTDEKTEKKNSK